MPCITIKTTEPSETLLVIKDAIELEKRLINESILKTRKNIQKLITSLNIDLKDFIEGKIEYKEENEFLLLELEGELEFLRRLEERLKRLENLEICA